MDITSFLSVKGESKKSKQRTKQKISKNCDKNKHKEHYGNKFLGLLNEFVKENIIDLLEYSNMVEFYKKKGSIVNLAQFCQIVNKIDSNLGLSEEKRDTFVNVCEKVFVHLFKPIGKKNIRHNEDIDTQKLSDAAFEERSEHIIFSSDQKKATNSIIQFLVSPEKKSFGLYGYAGTGKTTLIIEIVHFLLKHNYITSIVLAAPTNKAVNIMKAKFRHELKTLVQDKIHEYDDMGSFDDDLDKLQTIGIKVDFITIHKLLNYENDFDVEGNRIFIKGKNSNITKYDLVIIDECSMIPLDVVSNIFEELDKEGKKQLRDKIIRQVPKVMFVGDPAQLPPVGEKVSIIFAQSKKDFNFKQFEKIVCEDEDEKDNFYSVPNANNNDGGDGNDDENNITKQKFKILQNNVLSQEDYTLTEVVRSKDDMIVGLCNNIREWVMGTISEPTIGKFKGNGVFLYKKNAKGKHNSKWFKKHLDNISASKDSLLINSGIILTWTNDQTNEYNNQTRSFLFKDKKEKINKYEIGDILILSDFYNMDESEIKDVKHDNKGTNKGDNKRFYTSEQIKIANIEELVRACPSFGEFLPNDARKMKNSVIIGDKYKMMIKLINGKTKRKYFVWKLYTHRLTDVSVENTVPEVYQMYVIKDESLQDLEKDKEFCFDKIKILRQFFKSYYPEQLNQIDKTIIKPLWREINKILVEPFASVNIGNSITCHKSQGSTFYKTFVDIDDILKNYRKPDEAKRCIYTALTRASNEVHVYF